MRQHFSTATAPSTGLCRFAAPCPGVRLLSWAVFGKGCLARTRLGPRKIDHWREIGRGQRGKARTDQSAASGRRVPGPFPLPPAWDLGQVVKAQTERGAAGGGWALGLYNLPHDDDDDFRSFYWGPEQGGRRREIRGRELSPKLKAGSWVREPPAFGRPNRMKKP